MKKTTLIEAAGWIGVAAILAAYLANLSGYLDVRHPAYLTLNIAGSVGVMIDAWHQKNWQPAVLNLVWMIAAAIGLIRLIIH